MRLLQSGRQAMESVLSGDTAAALITRAQAEAAFAVARRSRDGLHDALAFQPWTFGALSQSAWPIGMAVKADNRSLAQALEHALQSLISSGRLQAIFAQHGVTWTTP